MARLDDEDDGELLLEGATVLVEVCGCAEEVVGRLEDEDDAAELLDGDTVFVVV